MAAAFFDAPLEYEFLARPVRARPATAAAMPEISADFRTITVRIKPGIYFTDDPAFKGKKRELVAEDYVFSIKRFYDPRWKSPNLYLLENAKILGLSELRKKLMAEKKPFDYDTPVEGLRALDRYTFQIRLAQPDPRFARNLIGGSLLGALAREVVEFYGDQIGAQFKGQRLPMVDEVRISIIEETQPRWLSFLNEEQDLIRNVPAEFSGIAFPNNQLAPNLAKQGIRMARFPQPDIATTYFGMENPLVGGYEPAKVALRRAISLAVDIDREIRLVRRNQAIPAQGIIAPGHSGYDGQRTAMSEFNLGRAKALLDMHGYVDKDGDGWRDQPDGKPLLLDYATSPDQTSRQLSELWQKNMKALGLKIEFKTAKWPENLKSSRAGKLMMWGVGWTSGGPDGDDFLVLGYGPNKGGANHARFDLSAYNALYEQQKVMPDGPERDAVMARASRLLVAYMPYKVHVHRSGTDLFHPWVLGYERYVFIDDFWKYGDLDPVAQRQGAGAPQ